MADTILVYKKGDIICKEGDYELWFYEVLSGSLTIYTNYGTEKQQEIGKVNGGFVGEMGFINSMTRIGTAVADDDVTLAKIDEDTFSSYFEEHPEKIYSILKCVSARLGEIDANTNEAYNTIKDLLEAYDSKKETGGALKGKMSKFRDVFKSRK